ncbi:MAG: phage DNA encapsidation protein [Turicibacter sp.]|nr:phage DNA encapsidation protein [Turicibacter sp.]
MLNEKDTNGLPPNIIMVETNRSTGKTTSFLAMFVKESLKHCECKFAILYRNKGELKGSEIILNGVNEIFYANRLNITGKFIIDNLIYQIRIEDGENVGYGIAICLKDRDKLKKYSPSFSTIDYILLDEFQSEDGDYLPQEADKMYSIYLTIARGGGKVIRNNVRVILLANNISLMNPYYLYFKVYKSCKGFKQMIRGEGWICHRWVNKDVADEITTNGVSKAMGDDNALVLMSVGKRMLFDTEFFIRKTPKNAIYILTIRVHGRDYGVRVGKDNYFYVSNCPDKNYPMRVCISISDLTNGYVLFRKNDNRFKALYEAFMTGQMYFSDLQCKDILLEVFNLKFI